MKKKGWTTLTMLGLAAVFLLCLGSFVFETLLKSSPPTSPVAQSMVTTAPEQLARSTTKPTDVAPATGMPKPSDTSRPTATLLPSTSTPIAATPISPMQAPAATLVQNTSTPLPLPIASKKTTALLPGLQPADVKVNLENLAFTCSDVQENKPYFIWTCKRETAQVQLRADIYGQSILSLDYINAAVMQSTLPNDDRATSFLGFIASMPYDGAEPDNARAWVEKTLPTITQSGDVRTATFGGVKYELFGIPTARVLRLGSLQ